MSIQLSPFLSVFNEILYILVLFYSYPVVLSSVTGSTVTNAIPFSASGIALIIFLTVLITGVNNVVEMCIQVLIMLAHRLIHRCNYW